jgi:hypothetical protein
LNRAFSKRTAIILFLNKVSRGEGRMLKFTLPKTHIIKITPSYKNGFLVK